jgi:NAD(P)H-hydrate epimerase
MLPVVTPDEMRAIDAAASRHTPVEHLIEAAGAAVARGAVRLLGGTYGRRVVVLAGPGNNGNDGRVAARRLRQRGVHVTVIDASEVPTSVPECDLVVDAAYGTGFRGVWRAPDVGGALVLAVDIPSGVDGLTGAAGPGVLQADATVTFAALKPGLLFAPGSALAGDVEVADIGLPVPAARAHLVQRADVADWVPRRDVDAHKWRSAVMAVAGSPGMTGAAHLATAAAMRIGAGIVHLASPGVVNDPSMPTEVVGMRLSTLDWAPEVLGALDRFRSLLVGPGLGRDDVTAAQARRVVVDADVPVVIDGDGLFAMAWNPDGAAALLRSRRAPTVLTPHDGEYALLAGERPSTDRILAARRLAADTRSVVLLKGVATVVADPTGAALVVTSGDERLATAGTGDVLTGMIAGLLALGVPAMQAAAGAAWLHGRAASTGPLHGLVAGDLLALVPGVVESLW